MDLDPSAISRLAQEALSALRSAREKLHHDQTGLVERQRDLEERDRTLQQSLHELDGRQREFAARLEELQRAGEQNDQQRVALAAEREHVRGAVEAVKAEQQACLTVKQRLAEEQKVHTAAVQSLAERESALKASRDALQREIGEWEPRQKELQNWELRLKECERSLESEVAELNKTREALTAMQAQLNRDHQEIAVQREELLQRLGSTPRLPATPPNADAVPEPAVETDQPAWHPAPKPAIARPVDQFRKLRRDAKRKAIGA